MISELSGFINASQFIGHSSYSDHGILVTKKVMIFTELALTTTRVRYDWAYSWRMEEVTVSSSPLFWGFITGFGLGAIFCVMSLVAHWKTKRELKRYQQHLSDKLQIEADQFASLKKDTDTLKTENENLRLKIGAGKSSDTVESLERELEIFARAERRMVVNAPGFASAWENAKSAAYEDIQEEERGKSLPRRLFKKFFPGSNGEDGKSAPARITTTNTIETDFPDGESHDNGNTSPTEHQNASDTVADSADGR